MFDECERFQMVFLEFIIEGCGLNLALSSRGPGRGPLKAQTRVRIPLALLVDRPHRLSVRTAPFHGAERGSIPLGAIWGITPEQRRAGAVNWGRSSVWLEHSTVTREVAGSSPVGPVFLAVSDLLLAVGI